MPCIDAAPWDARALGQAAWQANDCQEETLAAALKCPGLVSLRVDPKSDKRTLAAHGFYYCDTLLKPYCCATRLRSYADAQAQLRPTFDADKALTLAHDGFAHGRFFRDAAIPVQAARLRYRLWLQDLLAAGCVQGLFWQGKQAGFMAVQENALVLHAVAEPFRAKGLAKYWWTAICQQLYSAGHAEVVSSVSASNLAVVNLYASLGFRFREAADIYHRLSS